MEKELLTTKETLLSQHPTKPIYKKPKTSLFLKPEDINSGTQSISESNQGVAGALS